MADFNNAVSGLHPLTARYLARKVPEITVFFWIVKLLSTALGESAADYSVIRINPYLAVGLGGVGLLIALALQFAVKRYVAWIYWLAVCMVAVFGTMAADALHIQLGVPYAVSTIFFAVALAVTFFIWHRTEKTLSIHTINSYRRELFYWATVMATFALGTAAGDMTAKTLGLGYLTSGIAFAVLFAVPAIAFYLGWLGEVSAFWFAYVITRPLGASFADWLGKSRAIGGLGYGDAKVAIILTILIAIFVVYLTISRVDVKRSIYRNSPRR